MSRTRRLLTLAFICALSALVAPPALAAPTVAGTFDLPALSKRLTLGPDGNIWVAHDATGDNKEVSRVTPDGSVTSFDVTPNTANGGIVTGPDGNLWITTVIGLARFSAGDPTGTATQFTAGGHIDSPRGIAVGPDGNLWALTATKVVRIPPGAPNTGDAFTVLTNSANVANGIASGTDGRVWAADQGGGRVVSLTTDGAPTNHPVSGGGGPQDVAAGPAGQVAFSNPTSDPQSIGRLTQGASPLTTNLGAEDPFGAVFANDGAYWIAQFNGKNLRRLMPDGATDTFGDFSAGSHFPRNIARGAGNDLWVILDNPGNPSKIARITGVEPAAAGGAPTTPVVPPNARPSVSRILMASAFSVGRRPTAIGQTSAVGTRIRFTLSEAAAVRLTFQRALPGRRRGRRCVSPRRARPNARRCTRYRRFGAALRRNGVAGRNVVRFTGRIGRRPLRLGRHRLLVDATDSAGSKALRRTKRFRIVPRRRR